MSEPYAVPVKVDGKVVGMAKVTVKDNGYDIGVRLFDDKTLECLKVALSLSLEGASHGEH